MKIINNNPGGYPEVRNINVGVADVIEVNDVFNIGNKLKHKVTGKGYNPFFKGFFLSFKHRDIPCHLFNNINLGSNPWVVTFETTVPRLGESSGFWYRLGIRKLAARNCKKIIALSDCTYNRQIIFTEKNYPEFSKRVREKMIVMHPPQRALITTYDDKRQQPDKLSFTIVGADFFRKGGREILNVFAKLIPRFPQLHLNIVSSMSYGDYASKTEKQDYLKALEIIKSFPSNIFPYNKLQNNDVLELLKNTDVGLLPSWGDTYGYFVLEAQAAGCPVITTDLRAFPEINNDKIGWLIKVPLNELMDGDIDSVEKRSRFQNIIEQRLEEILLEIVSAPSLVKQKGMAALDRIKEEHSPQKYRKKLEDLYIECFGKDKLVH
ncbi:MAG: glycosyl transferase group 1 [Bacteroidota bacterium]|jgi:glycosyltransferase involved in cell wall biosynthesis|nr:glycosyl transferase group 1 [Bacteroidota bacterium]